MAAEEGHIIVCGLGHVGYRIVELLHRLAESVVIVTAAARDEWVREAHGLGYRVIIGDARDHQVLTQAGIESAKSLIASTDRDLTNIEIALDAKEMIPDLPVVLRVFDQTLAVQLETTFNVRRAFGMSAVAAPSFAAAALGEQVVGSFRLDRTVYVAAAERVDDSSPLLGKSVREVAEQFGLATLTLQQPDRELVVAPGPDTPLNSGDVLTVVGRASDWERAALPSEAGASALRRLVRALLKYPGLWYRTTRTVWRITSPALRATFVGLNILILLSVFVFEKGLNLSLIDSFYFVITTVTTVGYGDITPLAAAPIIKIYVCLLMVLGTAAIAILYSIITDYIVTSRFQQLLGRQPIPTEGHAIVVGLGNVGFRVVEELRRAGTRVVGIDRNPDGQYVEAVRLLSPVIIGDARMPEILENAGLSRARAVIAVSHDDAVNLSVGLTTAVKNPNVRTVVRLFDADFARKVQTALKVDVAMSGSRIAAPKYVAAALYQDVRDAFVLDDKMYVLVDRAAGDWEGLRPSDVESRFGVNVLMRRPAGKEHSFDYSDTPLGRQERVLAVLSRKLLNGVANN